MLSPSEFSSKLVLRQAKDSSLISSNTAAAALDYSSFFEIRCVDTRTNRFTLTHVVSGKTVSIIKNNAAAASNSLLPR